jgi:hypothetical protein
MKFRNQKELRHIQAHFEHWVVIRIPFYIRSLADYSCFLAARFKCRTALRNKHVVKASSFTIFETSLRTNKSHSNTT